MKSLKEIFEGENGFLLGLELVTTRGIAQQENSRKVIKFAEDLSKDTRVNWLSITDNAGGNPMFAPDYLGKKIMDWGKNTIIHVACKDFNRNGLESLAWKYASDGFNNLLALSGDYPIDGYNSIAQPVFDIDSVGLIKMLNDMNQGLEISGRKPGTVINLDKTDFYIGCAVSPFKSTEAEQMMQYEKLKMKIRNGAAFIVPQLGYNVRKSHELITYLRQNNLNVPVFGNIYKLNAGVARMFNRGMIPGCIVSDDLLARIDKEKTSEDKGKKFFMEYAAKQYLCFRAMGYTGAYFGGIDKYDDLAAILETAENMKDENWLDFVPDLTNPLPNEFYYFNMDEESKLSDEYNVNDSIKTLKRSKYRKYVSVTYRFNRLVHNISFDYKAPFFGFNRWRYKTMEKKGFKGLRKFAYFNERMIKAALFNCRECGDCSLPDIAYLCPQSQCAKNERNGPCGGSLNDKCEVTSTGKYCIWVKAYSRNKYFRGNPLLERPVVIKNNNLKDTSGWANCFLLRDHNAFKGKKADG
ncbi:MAG: methylenetetrahydrofolate reductase C-terminal domain-containing protein [Bacteroidota bacterium]